MNNFAFVIDKSDKRNEYVLKALEKDNFKTELFIEGHTYEDKSYRYVFIFAPSTVIDLNIAQQICNDSIIFCLGCEEKIREFLKGKNVTIYKLFDDEVLAMRNAYLTAEGTLAYIIDNTDITLKNMQVLVLGYGRVGKSVAKILHDNRCIVSIVTGKPEETAFAAIYADMVYDLEEYKQDLNNFSVIVNTIPCVILKGETLKLISPECFIIDLASKPGGLDYEEAAKLNLKTMHALGIPGKTAPKTAGEDIKKSILNILLKK